MLLRLGFWMSVMLAGFELNRRSTDISWGAEVVASNVKDFIERRLTTPTVRSGYPVPVSHPILTLFRSILNDIVLNKRTSLTDKEALKDAKRSLGAMLNDYLLQSK